MIPKNGGKSIKFGPFPPLQGGSIMGSYLRPLLKPQTNRGHFDAIEQIPHPRSNL